MTVPRQGTEPIPRVLGDPRGSFLTRDILILGPSQILVPELRAQLPCEANQHITVTAASPGTAGQARWDHKELPKSRRCCQELAPAPRGSTDQANPAPTAALAPGSRQERSWNAPGAVWRGQSWPCCLPQVKCFSQPPRVLPQSSPAAGMSIRRLGRVPGTPTEPSRAVRSCPIPVTAQSRRPSGTGVRVQPEAEAQEMPRQARSRGCCCCLQG